MNRVAQLKKEEEKSNKRIQETRRRAQEILSLRRRNEMAKIEKEIQLRGMQQEVEGASKEIAAMRDENEKKKKESLDRLTTMKKDLVKETKVLQLISKHLKFLS